MVLKTEVTNQIKCKFAVRIEWRYEKSTNDCRIAFLGDADVASLGAAVRLFFP